MVKCQYLDHCHRFNKYEKIVNKKDHGLFSQFEELLTRASHHLKTYCQGADFYQCNDYLACQESSE